MGAKWRRREQLVRAVRPAKTEETVSHRQNNDVKDVGTPPVQSSLCTSLTAVSTAVRNKVTKTVSEEQLLRNNRSKRVSSLSAQLYLPSLDVSWALLEVQLYLFALDLSWALLEVQLYLFALDLSWALLRLQLHLPALDLSWALLRLQLHLPALDLSCAVLRVQLHLPAFGPA